MLHETSVMLLLPVCRGQGYALKSSRSSSVEDGRTRPRSMSQTQVGKAGKCRRASLAKSGGCSCHKRERALRSR